MTLIDKAEAHDDDLIRRVAAAMWNAETIDAGVPKSVTDARTPEAFAEQSDFIRAKWMKLARAAIAALPARGVGVPQLEPSPTDAAQQAREAAMLDGGADGRS